MPGVLVYTDVAFLGLNFCLLLIDRCEMIEMKIYVNRNKNLFVKKKYHYLTLLKF